MDALHAASDAPWRANDCLCRLEPDALPAQFLRHPPTGFVVACAPHGMPGFIAPLDLLATADAALRKQVARWPLYRLWGRGLRWRTRFVGCTVTEYALLPARVAPLPAAQDLLEACRDDCALLVVKDLALDSPLLDARANTQARAFAAACEQLGFVALDGMALAWVPMDFDSTEAYLARLSSAGRKNLRRKMRSRAGLEIEIVPTGDPRYRDGAVLAEHYALYRSEHAQSQVHFDLLSPEFLCALLQDVGSGGRVFTYRHGGRLIGWNLCYEYEGKLVDKFIGLSYPAAREHNLYFVSWMENIEYALQRGLSHYVAGWTNAAVKRELGARFTHTRHLVYARNPLLRMLLRRLVHRFGAESISPA